MVASARRVNRSWPTSSASLRSRHFDAVGPRGDTQQEVGDHRSKDLQANRVVVDAQELANVEMLLDPAEQQFDLPTAFVEGGDFDCRSGKIVGEERYHPANVAPELDAP